MTRNLALILAAVLIATGPAIAACPAPETAADPAPTRGEAPQGPGRSAQVLVHERYVVLKRDADGQSRLVEGTRWIWRDRPAAPCLDPQEPAAGSGG